MPAEKEIMNALSTVIDPELGRNIVELTMVRDVQVDEAGNVKFTIALTIPSCPLKDKIKNDAEAAVRAVEGVKTIDITLGAMTDAERQEVFGKAQPNLPKINQFNKVGQIIAIMSGKGGVGKSSVTALMAAALAKKCQRVGVLDADVTGPSIPKVFGLPPGGVRGAQQGILPVVTGLGIKVISTNLLVDDETAPVIWRGPMISGAITQFWTDVLWGKLDYLLVDMPPGTSDAALTVMRSLPLNGVILVTTPQKLSVMVVKKAVSMCEQLNIPVLAVVENMSFYPCPDTGKEHAIFGPSHAGELAAMSGAKIAARLPIDPAITEMGDNGRIEDASIEEIDKMVDELLKAEKVTAEK